MRIWQIFRRTRTLYQAWMTVSVQVKYIYTLALFVFQLKLFINFSLILSAESNGKTNVVTLNGNGQNHQHSTKNCPKSIQIFQESAKSHCNTSPSNQTKISLSNNNLPMSNRNKHPTHIPYDPHLHRNSKPPYSFSCLIFMAIEDSPVKALPVKEVYAWILDRFPYFRNAPTGWKNSVRHNLSLNKCFRKVEKAPVGTYTQTRTFLV